MIRGLYTAASGMHAQEHRLDALANNLANVDTAAYKRDQSVHKAFPELLIRRMSDDGVQRVPFMRPIGSVDSAPVVGRLGTGVEQNEVYTVYSQGSLKESTNDFDLALNGSGFFVVDTPYGERLTRNGSFIIGQEGLLLTQEGFPVLGENGPIELKLNNFRVEKDGRIFHNPRYADDPNRLVTMRENEWEEMEELDQLRLVDVRRPRHLRKQGNSLYNSTWESGDPQVMQGDARPQVLQGYIETSNVNPVTEMVEMIAVNRAYESNQKVIDAQDQSTGKLLNEALRM
ncbi:MAG: flagellar basal-body rod protein FlgF [Spirochaeta sp.]|nr:flagellar basal-body rod protein FlgF [Spirochaeta sp.]